MYIVATYTPARTRCNPFAQRATIPHACVTLGPTVHPCHVACHVSCCMLHAACHVLCRALAVALGPAVCCRRHVRSACGVLCVAFWAAFLLATFPAVLPLSDRMCVRDALQPEARRVLSGIFCMLFHVAQCLLHGVCLIAVLLRVACRVSHLQVPCCTPVRWTYVARPTRSLLHRCPVAGPTLRSTRSRASTMPYVCAWTSKLKQRSHTSAPD
jgi:hypothetical protein